jgi:hypothetical protein
MHASSKRRTPRERALVVGTRALPAFRLRSAGDQSLANLWKVLEVARAYEAAGPATLRAVVRFLQEEAEERSLLYVALTRARDHLVIPCFPDKRRPAWLALTQVLETRPDGYDFPVHASVLHFDATKDRVHHTLAVAVPLVGSVPVQCAAPAFGPELCRDLQVHRGDAALERAREVAPPSLPSRAS